MLRNNLRLVSALVLLAFVVCHLTAHAFLLVSFARAEAALDIAHVSVADRNRNRHSSIGAA